MRKIFKYVAILLLLMMAYIGPAIGLSYYGYINKIPLGFGFYIKTPKKEKVIIPVTAESPIAILDGDNVSVYSIAIDSVSEKPVKRFVTVTFDSAATIQVKPDSALPFTVHLRKNPEIPAATYTSPQKLIAISDIEGNFPAFTSFLQGNAVIDSNYNWPYGDGHLVLNGDFFDRGSDVLECLWLIYKLEAEAETQGGKVHFILGNHEQMNIMGRQNEKALKYVSDKLFANADFLGLPYKEWFAPNTVLGQWLRTKNSIERIGPNLFVHGGISPAILDQNLSLSRLNELVRKSLDKTKAQLNQTEALLFSPEGHLWYRGMALEEVDEQLIEAVLNRFSAQKIILAHTILHEQNISTLYNKRVIAIDTHHEGNFEKGFVKGLLVTNGNYFDVDNHSRRQAL